MIEDSKVGHFEFCLHYPLEFLNFKWNTTAIKRSSTYKHTKIKVVLIHNKINGFVPGSWCLLQAIQCLSELAHLLITPLNFKSSCLNNIHLLIIPNNSCYLRRDWSFTFLILSAPHRPFAQCPMLPLLFWPTESWQS